MIGKYGGVAAKLKQLVPCLVVVHCMVHRYIVLNVHFVCVLSVFHSGLVFKLIRFKYIFRTLMR